MYYDRAAGIMKVTDDYTIREFLTGGDRNRQEIESEVEDSIPALLEKVKEMLLENVAVDMALISLPFTNIL